jgi:hypothetical protein
MTAISDSLQSTKQRSKQDPLCHRRDRPSRSAPATIHKIATKHKDTAQLVVFTLMGSDSILMRSIITQLNKVRGSSK